VANFGLDSETALKLILIVLRGAAYFFGGFALVGLSAYVVFLCLEIFSPRPQVKATIAIAEVPKPPGCASGAEPTQNLVPAEAPTPAEEATVSRER
jgi:hypothetical protein